MAEVHLPSCSKNFCVCIRHLSNQHIQEDNDHHEEEGQIQDHTQGPEEKSNYELNFIVQDLHAILYRHVNTMQINYICS